MMVGTTMIAVAQASRHEVTLGHIIRILSLKHREIDSMYVGISSIKCNEMFEGDSVVGLE
jgi:hypothetical protein